VILTDFDFEFDSTGTILFTLATSIKQHTVVTKAFIIIKMVGNKKLFMSSGNPLRRKRDSVNQNASEENT